MKLFFLLVLVAIIAIVVYVSSSQLTGDKKKRKQFSLKPLGITAGVVIVLLVLIVLGVYKSAMQSDIQCSTTHNTTMKPPANLQTAADYFTQGDYEYEIGDCQQAIADYTKAIILNPNYPQAYNNRAYTNMRMRNYKDALPDLDRAIQLNPHYIQALMNRGDIHNYYYEIDRQAAIADYERVIALTGPNGSNTSVCGHLFLAKHNGWTLGAYIDFFRGTFRTCN